jgi:4-aminobutyrate aminotransferase
MLVEPIQGVGGFVTPPPEYFGIVADIVRDYGGLFIVDEVQTGFGRTGTHWFGIEHWGVEPELMTCAKGMANGAPIGATIATAEIADAYPQPSISTFGGNPVTMTAALVTIEVIEEEGLLTQVTEVGSRLREGLLAIQQETPIIGDVRGKGLMLGVELVHSGKAPAPELATRVLEEARRRGLLVGRGGMYSNVLRITPPLNVSPTEVEDALEILSRVFAAVQGEQKR